MAGNGENGLVYSKNKEIYLYREDEDDVLIVERDGRIDTLAYHDGRLYDGGIAGNITDTLSGEVIASRSNILRPLQVKTLCSHEGVLYDAGESKKVADTFGIPEVASRDKWIWAMCSHNGKLYDAGSSQKVFDTFSGEDIATRGDWIWGLCSHEGKLYDSVKDGQVFDTFSGDPVASRGDWIWNLFSHNGILYDIGVRGAFGTLTGKRAPFFGVEMESTCSVPKSLVDTIIRGEWGVFG